MINMKKNWASVFTGLALALILSGCVQSQPEYVITETIQSSQTLISHTSTPFPTLTQSPTFTITPTATLTPNFFPPVATKTLLPSATCPQQNQNTIFDFTDFESSLQINTANDLENAMEIAQNSLLNYMNAGGMIDNVARIFQKEQREQKPNYLGQIKMGDITGDGVAEVFVWLALPSSEEGLPNPRMMLDWIKQFFPMPVYGTRTFVFDCKQGNYAFLGTIKDNYYNNAVMPTIADLNADGVGEIIQPIYDFAGSGYALHMHILNWNGKEFTNSLHDELREDWMSSFSEGFLLGDEARVRSGNFSLQDIDNNGTTEVVISSDDFRGAQPCEILYRETKMVLMWNGDHFIGFYWRTPPTYRIQAIWDGDHESVHGLLSQALLSYQKVLDDTLLPWSLDYQNLVYPLCTDIPGSTPIPVNALPDEDEASRLKAYSLYRIMLLKLVQGDFSSGEENYKLLQKNYQNAYQQLAKIFWDEYLNTNNIIEACQTTVAYTEANQEKILHLLDRRTYGNIDSLTPIYQAEDICPYK